MKKSPAKVIELFVYIIILILAFAWSFKGGNKVDYIDVSPNTKQDNQIQQDDNVIEYKLPPKNEFMTNP